MVDHDVIRQRRLARWRPRLEPLLEERDQVDRHHQEDQDDAEELHGDDEQHHERVLPVAIVAIAGGRDRLGGPLQSRPEVA